MHGRRLQNLFKYYSRSRGSQKTDSPCSRIYTILPRQVKGMKENKSPGVNSRRNSTSAKVRNNGEIEFIRHITPQTGKCTGGTADFSFFTASFFFFSVSIF